MEDYFSSKLKITDSGQAEGTLGSFRSFCALAGGLGFVSYFGERATCEYSESGMTSDPFSFRQWRRRDAQQRCNGKYWSNTLPGGRERPGGALPKQKERLQMGLRNLRNRSKNAKLGAGSETNGQTPLASPAPPARV